MRQIAQATGYTAPTRSHHMIVLAALLAFLATAAVVLAVAVGNNTAGDTRLTDQPVSAVRGDGGPEESVAAAAIGAQNSVVRPDESSIAAAVSSGDEPAPAPRAFGGAIPAP